jgi:hypothetical protein
MTITLVDPNFGGSLAGYLEPFTYAELVTALGAPNGITDGYKTEAEWAVEVNGTRAHIYDYKIGKSYCGDEDGFAVEDITEWHVGAERGWNPALAAELSQEIRTTLNGATE